MSGVKKGGSCGQKIQCLDPCKDPCQVSAVCLDPCQEDPCNPHTQYHSHHHHAHYHDHIQKDPCNPCCPKPCQCIGICYCNK
ncbi:proline-rich protein 9-like [Hyperolius riggenbachi]|uniref:proline-rich protein 9-like n=1 Tax=Hyperolius riggenbachi TaxID=752182 RepID=UPI0035A2DAD5